MCVCNRHIYPWHMFVHISVMSFKYSNDNNLKMPFGIEFSYVDTCAHWVGTFGVFFISDLHLFVCCCFLSQFYMMFGSKLSHSTILISTFQIVCQKIKTIWFNDWFWVSMFSDGARSFPICMHQIADDIYKYISLCNPFKLIEPMINHYVNDH